MKPLIPGLAEIELRSMVHGFSKEEQAVIAEALDHDVLVSEVDRRMKVNVGFNREYMGVSIKASNEEKRRIGAI